MFLGQKQVTNSSNLHVLQNYKHTHVNIRTYHERPHLKHFFLLLSFRFCGKFPNFSHLPILIPGRGRIGRLDIYLITFLDFCYQFIYLFWFNCVIFPRFIWSTSSSTQLKIIAFNLRSVSSDVLNFSNAFLKLIGYLF